MNSITGKAAKLILTGIDSESMQAFASKVLGYEWHPDQYENWRRQGRIMYLLHRPLEEASIPAGTPAAYMRAVGWREAKGLAQREEEE